MSSVDAQTVVSTPFVNPATIGIAGPDTITLPKGFPDRIAAHNTFTGNDFTKNEKFIYYLTVAEVAEIKLALATFKGKINPAIADLMIF